MRRTSNSYLSLPARRSTGKPGHRLREGQLPVLQFWKLVFVFQEVVRGAPRSPAIMLSRMQQKRASDKANKSLQQNMESAMAGLEMSSGGGDGLGEGEAPRPRSVSRWKDAARRARGDTGYVWCGVQCGPVVCRWGGGVWRHGDGWEWGCIG